MSLVPLLVLPLVGGYAFSSIWSPSLYHATRESGHRLYFRAIFYAVVMLVCGAFLHVCLYAWGLGGYKYFIEIIAYCLDANDTGLISLPAKVSILLLSFVLGPLMAHALDAVTNTSVLNVLSKFEKFIPLIIVELLYRYQRMILLHAIDHNDFEKLMVKSLEENKLLSLTMNSGKVYVGWAVQLPDPRHERKFLRIMPAISGYRDDEKRIIFTTDYYELLVRDNLNHVELQDFEIVISLCEITHCSLFDINAYDDLNDNEVSE